MISSEFRRRHAVFIIAEAGVATVGTLTVVAAARRGAFGHPSGWITVAIVLAGLGALGVIHWLLTAGFELNSNGVPLTARDADRYSAYRAKLCTHERAALDSLIEENRDQPHQQGGEGHD